MLYYLKNILFKEYLVLYDDMLLEFDLLRLFHFMEVYDLPEMLL